MKLKYLFSIILSSVLLFAGCVSEEKEALNNIKLSSTYLSIPEEGGTVSVTINATEDWAFVETSKWPGTTEAPHWLSAASVMSSGPGEKTVTFTAGEGAGREIELSIQAGTRTQFLRIIQGVLEVQEETCYEANQGPDGRLVRASGVVTGIENTTYGNWTLKDATGTLYIYGTLYDGQTKQFAKLGLEEGDEVTVEGPRGSYNGKSQLVNVTVVKHIKSLLKITTAPLAAPLAKKAQEYEIEMQFKGDQLLPLVPEEFREWISVVNIQTKPGTPSKIDPNPASTAVATIRLTENTAVTPRYGSVNFTSKKGESSSNVEYKISQLGNMPDLKPISDIGTLTYVHTEGQLAALCQRGYILDDGTGAVLVYYGSSYNKPYKIGDKVKIVGTPSVYNFGQQVGTPDYEELIESGTFTYATPKVYDEAALLAVKASVAGKTGNKDAVVPIEYVKLTGTLNVSGSYYNLNFAETTEVIGSIYYPIASIGLEDQNGKKVHIYGYTTSFSGGKYLNLVATSYELAE